MEYKSKNRNIEFTTILEDSKNATIFRHFKGKEYKILSLANHSETWEELVVYHEVGNTSHCCARPIDMFFSEVDHEKYPDVVQKYRFEEIID